MPYDPVCSIDKTKRRISFKKILTSNKDFTSMANGALLQFVVKNVFLNPDDERAINVAMSINIKDGDGNVIADYDPSTQEALYSAKAGEIKQLSIRGLNQKTGAVGVYDVQFNVLAGQKFASGTYLELNLPSQLAIPPNK